MARLAAVGRDKGVLKPEISVIRSNHSRVQSLGPRVRVILSPLPY